MAEINLEAEQIVEEEGERAPREKRSPLAGRRTMIFFGAVLVVEAIALFIFFEVMRGPSAPTHADDPGAESAPAAPAPWGVPDGNRLDLGEISITEDNVSNPKADRRAGVRVQIQVDKETYGEIERATESNPDATELVKLELSEEIRVFLLGKGIQRLKAFEVQLRLPDEIEAHLLERLPQLRNRLRKVYVTEVTFARY